MFIDCLTTFIPIMCLAVNVSSQIIIFRNLPKLGLLKSVFLGFLFGLLILFLSDLYILSKSTVWMRKLAAISAVHLLTYLSLGYCYFHFINLGETARRIRILRELRDSPKGLSLGEILVKYNAKEITDRRISRLIKNRQVVFRDGKYYIGAPPMLLAARCILAVKILVLGKRSEFD